MHERTLVRTRYTSSLNAFNCYLGA